MRDAGTVSPDLPSTEKLVRVAVVLATYNQEQWLEKALWGYAAQTHRDFDVIIADDGSGPATAEVIARMRREAGLRISHVWHEHRGFGKWLIVNRAIASSDADYMIFSDGDCIPRNDFVARHMQLAEPGHFLAGGYLKLPVNVSERITPDDIRSGRVADLGFLWRAGYRPGHRALRLIRSMPVATVLDAVTPTPSSWRGNNSSVWRDGLIAVNGFDSDMGYGSGDRAIGERLLNLGYRSKRIRFRTAVLHLHHERPWRNNTEVARNEERIATEVWRDKETRARVGLAELEPLDAASPYKTDSTA
jgi:glycosyltransferase involved in cell wall biosynthesis